MRRHLILTATWPDGRIDEQVVWIHVGDKKDCFDVGHGDLIKIIQVGGLDIHVHLESDEEPMPTVEFKDVTNGWVPKVGDGCHDGFNGDTYPSTVRYISPSGKTIWTSGDDYRVKPGKGNPYEEGAKDCFFFPKAEAPPKEHCSKWMRKKDGRFREAGKHGHTLCPGRQHSRNPHY